MPHSKHKSIDTENKRNRKKLIIVLSVTFSFMIIEFVGGYLSNSLALISDATHMLTDSVALIITLSSFYIANRPPDIKNSYGLRRAETVAGFINGVFLVFLSGGIIISAIERLLDPPEVNAMRMMGIAVIGLFVNLFSAKVLSSGQKSSSLALKSALIHVLSDALSSVAAIVAAYVILTQGLNIIDPILSFVVAGIILFNAFKLIKSSGHIILQAVPDNIDLQQLVEELHSIPGVCEVHDCHAWSLSNETSILTVHLVSKEKSEDYKDILYKAKSLLSEKFEIHHSTIQIEPPQFEEVLFNIDGEAVKH